MGLDPLSAMESMAMAMLLPPLHRPRRPTASSSAAAAAASSPPPSPSSHSSSIPPRMRGSCPPSCRIVALCSQGEEKMIRASRQLRLKPAPKPKPDESILLLASSDAKPEYDYEDIDDDVDDDGDEDSTDDDHENSVLHRHECIQTKCNDHEEEEDDDDDDDEVPQRALAFHAKPSPKSTADSEILQQAVIQVEAKKPVLVNDVLGGQVRFQGESKPNDDGKDALASQSKARHGDSGDCDGNDCVILHQARFALSSSLREAGLSEEDSIFVSSNAPRTLQALMDASLELQELATWTSSQGEILKEKDLGLYDKILGLCLADRGRWRCRALMESFGVGQQHLPRIIHVLASQHISDLMIKIKFLEDTLPDVKDEGIAVRSRRMMREISISPDDSLQKTLSFFEKMEARPGGISSLCNPRKALPYLMEEFPQAFCRDFRTDLKTLIAYFEELGVPKDKLASVIMIYPSILLYNNIEELQHRLRTLRKEANVKSHDYGTMIVKYPWILSRGVADNVKEVVEFLKSTKVSPKIIRQSITKCPNLLGSGTRTLKAMTHQLVLIGLKDKKIGYVIARSPQLLLKTPRAFLEIVEFMKSLGLEEEDMPKLLATTPSVFASTIPFLKTKIRFFHLLGIRDERMKMLLQKYPKVLSMSVERSLKPRLWFLQSMGLSNKDIAFMICGFPALLGYSVDHVLKPKFEMLRDVLCNPVSDVITYPRYFSYCARTKILPRSRILKRQSEAVLDLKAMLSKNDDEFAEQHLGFGRMLVPPM